MEKIVGKKFVSGDPGIMDTYAFQLGGDILTKGAHKFGNRPLCVVLPASTKEIVEIVKFCNSNKIQYKAFSTGWGTWNLPGWEDKVIQIDLRRMDKILSIDSKNMIAIVESYVNGAMLQAELFKIGLNCHIAGCGSNTSLLASACSLIGMGWTGISTGFSGRNILGIEWVMPDGNILKIGSWDSFEKKKDTEVDASEWFLPDGPGPGIRGILRGYLGTLGGLGVFTKVALKLYHWAGPPRLEVEGHFPSTNLKNRELPPFTAVYAVDWQNWEDFKDAGYQLAYSEVCFALNRTSAFTCALGVTPNNTEFERIFNSALKDIKYNFLIITMANTEREYEYHKKVIDTIVKQTRGSYIKLFQVSTFSALLFLVMVKNSNNVRGVFRAGGGFKSSLGALGSWDWCVEGAKIGEKTKRKIIETGGIVDDMADNAWGEIDEGGNFGHLEELFMYDVSNKESREGARSLLKGIKEDLQKYPLGIGIDSLITPPNFFGPLACNYHIWVNAIKMAFDPNNSSDPVNYIRPKVRLKQK